MASIETIARLLEGAIVWIWSSKMLSRWVRRMYGLFDERFVESLMGSLRLINKRGAKWLLVCVKFSVEAAKVAVVSVKNSFDLSDSAVLCIAPVWNVSYHSDESEDNLPFMFLSLIDCGIVSRGISWAIFQSWSLAIQYPRSIRAAKSVFITWS